MNSVKDCIRAMHRSFTTDAEEILGTVLHYPYANATQSLDKLSVVGKVSITRKLLRNGLNEHSVSLVMALFENRDQRIYDAHTKYNHTGKDICSAYSRTHFSVTFTQNVVYEFYQRVVFVYKPPHTAIWSIFITDIDSKKYKHVWLAEGETYERPDGVEDDSPVCASDYVRLMNEKLDVTWECEPYMTLGHDVEFPRIPRDSTAAYATDYLYTVLLHIVLNCPPTVQDGNVSHFHDQLMLFLAQGCIYLPIDG